MNDFRRKYRDSEIITGFLTGNRAIQQGWYNYCHAEFSRIMPKGPDGLPDYYFEDLFQESFILLWAKFKDGGLAVKGDKVVINSRTGEHECGSLIAYFVGIVKIKTYELIRKGLITKPVLENIGSLNDKPSVDYSAYSDPNEEKERIVRVCLQQLPKSCFEILSKFYYQMKTLEQILAERNGGDSYNGLKTQIQMPDKS